MIDQQNALSRAIAGDYSVELLDVQGLFGGRNVLVSRSGDVWVQSVRPPRHRGRLTEKQYVFRIPADDADRIHRALAESDFLSLRSEDRPGVPDEARPEIVLWSGDGEQVHEIAFWERSCLPPGATPDSDRQRINRIYGALRRLESVALERVRPVRKGTWKGRDSWQALKKRSSR